ncbi:hypothetical protein BZG21_39400, partial [Escherichia coli]|nr:hypothetical protein [Escherichia coli]
DPYTGMKINALLNPDGEWEEDQRVPGKYKPDWVEIPESLREMMNSRASADSEGMKPMDRSSQPEGVQANAFAERGLRVAKVLKKSGKGGVFLVSTRDLNCAVMKEATHRMRVDRHGRSCHDYLSNEYAMLKRLEHTGVVPRAYELFSHEHNSYLLIEYFQGVSLREFVHQGLITAELDGARLYPL